MATDPICGMTVDPAKAAGVHEHQGQTYYFCSSHCAKKFQEDAAGYVKTTGSSRPAGKAEIDPVCGMTVEPARAAGKPKHGDAT